jgi:rubrerythrin
MSDDAPKMELPMDLARFLNQQNVERYRKLLERVTDATQRRQIVNLLEEEQQTASELQAIVNRLERPEAA